MAICLCEDDDDGDDGGDDPLIRELDLDDLATRVPPDPLSFLSLELSLSPLTLMLSPSPLSLVLS